jgi:hypothetical protein
MYPEEGSVKSQETSPKIPRGKWKYMIEHEHQTDNYDKTREDFPTYQEWFEASHHIWIDDAKMWGLRGYPGYKLTAIVHYCSDYEFGSFTGTLSGAERCALCHETASDEVVGLHMLQNPKWYDRS